MKKPEEQEPKDITEEELSEQEAAEVSGGVFTGGLSKVTPIAKTDGCNCKKGQGGTADWEAVG